MSDSPIIAHESGHDFEINVFFGDVILDVPFGEG